MDTVALLFESFITPVRLPASTMATKVVRVVGKRGWMIGGVRGEIMSRMSWRRNLGPARSERTS